jgi:hypothetical protein
MKAVSIGININKPASEKVPVLLFKNDGLRIRPVLYGIARL